MECPACKNEIDGDGCDIGGAVVCAECHDAYFSACADAGEELDAEDWVEGLEG